jgi:DNA modification methylase
MTNLKEQEERYIAGAPDDDPIDLAIVKQEDGGFLLSALTPKGRDFIDREVAAAPDGEARVETIENCHLTMVNRLFTGHAASIMAIIPARSVDLVVTSPPYWTAVSYSAEHPWHSYAEYLADLQTVWVQCARVLRPNGKLCINAMPMPLPKNSRSREPRELLHIPCDIMQGIRRETNLRLYDEIVWRKQTSKAMQSCYPHAGNAYMNNCTERITVYVKPGDPQKPPVPREETTAYTWPEWLDFTQQIWKGCASQGRSPGAVS